MKLHSNPWLRTAYARLWVRAKSIYGEPLWVAVNVGFPFFTSFSFTMVYRAYGLGAYAGFAILGGVMISFGQRSMVNGKPVQLGQAGRTLRNLHQFSRTHHSHTGRDVSRRDLRHRTIRGNGGSSRLGYFRSTDPSLLASSCSRLLSDPCVSLRDGHGPIFPLLGLWSRG